jgi:hypothetical protein
VASSLHVHKFGHPWSATRAESPRVLFGNCRSAVRCSQHRHRISRWRAWALPVVPTAADRAPHRPQNPQDGTDDQQDDPKRYQDPQVSEPADDEQDQSENKHAATSSSPPSRGMRRGTRPTGLCSFPRRGVNPSSPMGPMGPMGPALPTSSTLRATARPRLAWETRSSRMRPPSATPARSTHPPDLEAGTTPITTK